MQRLVAIFAAFTGISLLYKIWSDVFPIVTDVQPLPFREKESILSSLLSDPKMFTLVLQANVKGGTAGFLKAILTPDCVVITPLIEMPGTISQYSLMPTTDALRVRVGALAVKTSSQDLLAVLRKNDDKFHKVFINHPLGFSLPFLSGIFELGKRYVAMTHDYIWVLDKLQVTFADCHSPEGAARNYAFKSLGTDKTCVRWKVQKA